MEWFFGLIFMANFKVHFIDFVYWLIFYDYVLVDFWWFYVLVDDFMYWLVTFDRRYMEQIIMPPA